MEFFGKDYIEAEKLPLKNLDVVKIKGNAQAGIPNRYKVGDKTVRGIQLGPAPVGPEIQGVEKRGRFALPGTNAAIRGYLDNGDKSGGSNPSSWDKDDINLLDRFVRGITAKDVENAEKNRTYQELQEQYKNKRFAGKKLELFWGDTPDSVKERIEMMESVNNNRNEEPVRLQKELEDARMLGEAQNNSIRALNASNSNEAFMKNKFLLLQDQEAHRKKIEDARYDERQKEARRERDQEQLRYEERLRNELRRESAQLDRQQMMDKFTIRQYEDREDRLDREEKRDEDKELQRALSAIGGDFSSFF